MPFAFSGLITGIRFLPGLSLLVALSQV